MPDWIALVRERLPASLCSRERIEELAHELEDAYEDNLARGFVPAEAERKALASVADWSQLGENLRRLERRRFTLRNTGLAQDIRIGVRVLRANPATTMLASLALALAIGANTVAFSFVRTFLFQPLPVHEAEGLVRIYGSLPDSLPYASLSYPDFLSIREQDSVFTDVLVEKLIPLSMASENGNERLWGYLVSGNYFTTLGISPAAGSFFAEDVELLNGEPVVVVSYAFWQSSLAGRTDAIGASLSLNGHVFTIVGVAAPEFAGTNTGLAPALWAPASAGPWLMPGIDLMTRTNRSFQSLGRLRAGVTVSEAGAALDVLAEGLAQEYVENRGYGFNVLPESEGGVHPIMRGGFIGFSGVLVVVVALVLALACANVAGLALARAATRRKEVSLRVALGATPGRLVRQFLTESLLLSLVGCGLGLILAQYSVQLLRALQLPTDLPLRLPVAIEPWVLAFATAVAVLAGILVGLVPALRAARPAPIDTGRAALRNAFVVGQIALSTVLLVGTGIFLKNLANARDIDLGFDPTNVVLASIDLDLEGYSVDEGRQFFVALEERVLSLPGVQAVGFAEMIPFELNINMHEVAPEGYEPPADGSVPSIDRNIVTPGYFQTMATTLVDGRDFTERDNEDAPAVVIVNETLATRFWPNERAVGKRMGRPGGSLYEVVGVVEDGKYLTLGEDPKAFFFYPFLQRNNLAMTLAARTAGAPAVLLGSIRETVRELDPGIPVFNVKPMEEHLKIALAPARAGVAIFASFGGVSIALASLGLYALLAFLVAQRTHDIGIRRALGAAARDVLRPILEHAMKLTASGLLLGMLASLALTRVTASLLYGVSGLDAGVYLAVAVVLVATALSAAYVPARRATRVDPLIALRDD